MTTLTLNIDDNLANTLRVRSRGMELKQYVELFLTRHFSASESKEAAQKASYNHEALCGIFSNEANLDELRESYIEDKYGL